MLLLSSTKHSVYFNTVANKNKKATYMEKGLDHFAWSTPCGREVNDYKLLTSRLQFCLKFSL